MAFVQAPRGVLVSAFVAGAALAQPFVAGAQQRDGNNGAAASDTTTLEAVRLPQEGPRPAVDGQVDEEIWKRARVYATFTQQEPAQGEPATEKTEVRLLIDRSTLYIGIICFDSEPDKIIVNQSRRDADLNDADSVQVLLDTYNDNQNAFVFGTNPIGIEYDGQVFGEGQTSGFVQNVGRSGQAGSQRGQISGFNANWDGDWTVRSQTTARGWETELAIPLKTLRYNSGSGRTWGFNVMRNIRRKNEQVFLSPIPRGYSLHRVSLAAKIGNLDLPPRRDIKAIPFVAGSYNKDMTVATDRVDRKGDVGLDIKWGVRPNLTADFTVNTDFAQVEADEEQVNLTRFPLFFPEKRGFFLENASTFQFGAPQQADLFFSRRIGLSANGEPIDIVGGGRLSGKLGAFNVGVLNMQTEKAADRRSNRLIAPANNFSVVRVQRQVGRSNFGGIFVNRQGVGSAAADSDYNRAYGVDANLQLSANGKMFAFIARTDSTGTLRSDYAGKVTYNYAGNLFQTAFGYSQVGDRFNPETGFLPRRGYRLPEGRFFLTYKPKTWTWIRTFSPHWSSSGYYGFDGKLQTSRSHYHFFEIQPRQGGRFGVLVDRIEDRPTRPFVVYSGTDGRRVVIPPALYGWNQLRGEYFTDPSAKVFANLAAITGGFYNGDFTSTQIDVGVRVGAMFSSSISYDWQDIELPQGDFTTQLVGVKASYAFNTLTSLQALIQYNSQTAQASSNIRLAILNRSGTGLFIVYNDRRETSDFTPADLLGRSFVIKYTRLMDF